MKKNKWKEDVIVYSKAVIQYLLKRQRKPMKTLG
jgi:hypothetical protein